MIAAAAGFVADQDAKSIVIFMIAMCCLAVVVAVCVLICLADRDRVRIDPNEHDFSKLPGFSRDQLERIARMPVPPLDEQPRILRGRFEPSWAFESSRSSPEVALRSKRAGTVSPLPSDGAGVSQSGARRGS